MRIIKKIIPALLLTILAVSTVNAQVPSAEVTAEIINGENGGYRIVAVYTFPEGYHQTFQQDFFKFEILSPEHLSIGPINYPEPADADETSPGNFYETVFIDAELIGFNPSVDKTVTIRAHYQLCNEDGLCLFPASTVVEAAADYTAPAETAGGFGKNPAFFLILAFLGGLLLNVMPCVLPVLSIKALSLVKQGGEDRKQILKSSMLYTAGVLLSMAALAAVIIVIKASGEQVGWGFQFQNRGFVLVLLTVIFLFALSLFEVFTISAPVIRTGSPIKSSGSAASHLLSGVLAVLLATPCTAPLLGTAAGFAFSQPAPVIAAVFIMVGLGLAFPFILIGFVPAVVSRLPRPGAWMNIFRAVMGFLLIGTSVWLLDVLIYQSPAGYLTRVLIYLTAAAFAAWLYGRLSAPGASTGRRLTGLAAAVLIIAASAALLLGGTSADTQQAAAVEDNSGYSGWIDFAPDTVNKYIGGDRPVFVAFSAKWCMTCRTNESTVIFTDEIQDFFKSNDAVLIHGDYTLKNPDIDRWLKSFGRAGVPFYTWYPAGSTEAILLPEIISRKTIKELPK